MARAHCGTLRGPYGRHRSVRGAGPAIPVAIVQCALTIALAAVSLSPAAAQSQEPIDAVLPRMFAYVEQFMRDFGGMVSEELYVQSVRQATGFSRGDTRRELKSDFLLVNVPGQGWTPFRDVFEADGRQVRDRQDRLAALFLSGTTTDAINQARRIMDEGARYNIGGGTRNINVPTLALMYFVADARGGIRFTDKGRTDEGRIVEFLELQRPTLISTTGGRDLPAHGRIWIDEPTGTVTKTELRADDTGVETQITVSFERDAGLGMWVPKRMEDRFKRRGDTAEVRGVATYSRFRRFQVSTSEELAPADGGGKP
jgi:hypothetical protein